MFVTTIERASWTLLLLCTAFLATEAAATPPPDLPLPPCIEEGGVRQGACPATSEDVAGEAVGRFSAGGMATVRTDPTHGVCVHHNGYPPYPWSPSPCYSAVTVPRVITCGFIDLQNDNVFRELPCAQALYREPQNLPNPLFSIGGEVGSTACGARGAFGTYVYGGPANVPGARWSDIGPTKLDCPVVFNGPRPDGLYGPTWVKFRVGIEQSENGDERRGYSRSAEVYVPIDGDLREESVDVSVMATSSLEGSGDDLTVTYTATLTNLGGADAENFELMFILPGEIYYHEVSNTERCVRGEPEPFVGGTVICRGLNLAGTGDPLGRDVDFIEVVGRIINATDLEDPVVIRATVADDINPSNNEDSTFVRPTLRSGSIAETRQAMQALAPYFDYETPLLDLQCDVYMNDIFARLESIYAQAPEVFANLSFGRVTSGDYRWAPVDIELTRAAHVGVVMYLKGTDYRETGIVIHGTPTWSPTDRDDESQMGSMEAGEHTTLNVFRQGTADHGMYYRTPISNFPGSAGPEAPWGCGFEGLYTHNRDEFRGVPPAGCVNESLSCPFFPDAVVVRTESPVDVLVTNTEGQRVETRDGGIFVQELDGGIHSFATSHDDGTFGWILVLPEDDYDIELLGTGEGPYRLTLTTFNDAGEAVETVFEGQTESGQVNEYHLAGAPSPDPGDGGGGDTGGGGTGGGGGGNTGGGDQVSSGGGGSFGFLSLLALALVTMLCLRSRRLPWRVTVRTPRHLHLS